MIAGRGCVVGRGGGDSAQVAGEVFLPAAGGGERGGGVRQPLGEAQRGGGDRERHGQEAGVEPDGVVEFGVVAPVAQDGDERGGGRSVARQQTEPAGEQELFRARSVRVGDGSESRME